MVTGRCFIGTAKHGRQPDNQHLLEQAYAAESLALQPKLRMGELHLTRGRGRLLQGKPPEAENALRDALEARPGSLEAPVLLVEALRRQGKADGAAWEHVRIRQLYAEQAKFERRKSYRWFWKANPAAAALYIGTGVAIIALAIVGAFVLESTSMDVALGEGSVGSGDVEFVVGLQARPRAPTGVRTIPAAGTVNPHATVQREPPVWP